jgi:hypothetical protein
MRSDRYWVAAHERRYPSAARPQWIIIHDGKDRPTVVSKLRPLTWSADLRNARFFLKRDAKRLLLATFGEGWEEFVYLVRP